MNEVEISAFAANWITVQKAEDPKLGNSRRRDDDSEYENIFELMRMSDPKEDWKQAIAICIEVARQSGDPWILEILGAGPLEDLLSNIGDPVLPSFLTAAQANPSFRQALRHVWPCQNANLWRKFEAIRDELKLPA
jgi:hypothetical protein